MGLSGHSYPQQIELADLALSDPLLSASQRTRDSWWLFLAHSYPQQIVLPVLGGSFWPTLNRNESYSRVLVALSGPFLFVTNRGPGSWWLVLAHSYPYQIVLPGLGGALFSVTYRIPGPLLTVAAANRTPGSWWLCLAHS